MARESENKTIERVMENIVFCHFQNAYFEKLKNDIQIGLELKGQICIHADTRKLSRKGSAGNDDPDKYLEDENGKKVLVEFKVGGRDTSRNIADQLNGYFSGFQLPIVMITCWKRDPVEFDELLVGGLRRNKNLFYYNFPIQEIMELALQPSDRPEISHARFFKTEDAYFLTKQGTAETRTLGLCWSAKYKTLYLPACGLSEGRDPIEGPFTTSQRNSTYVLTVKTKNLKTLDSFEERVKYRTDKNGRLEVLWPCKGLLDAWQQINGMKKLQEAYTHCD